MNVSVENLGVCKWLMRVEVPAEEVDKQLELVTQKYRKSVKMPGFRAGKVPTHILMRNYETGIADTAKDEILEAAYREGSRVHNVRVLRVLNVESEALRRGQPAQLTLTVEAYPQFTLPTGYKGMKLRRDMSVVTDDDMARALAMLRDRQAQYKDLDRPLQSGDIAVLSFKAEVEGVSFEQLTALAPMLAEKKDFYVLITPDAYLPGFTDPLVGASVGEKRTVQLALPMELTAEELRGKAATYEVEINGIKEKVLPEADDELAKIYGAEDLDQLLRGIRSDLEREKASKQRQSIHEQLRSGLEALVPMELPEGLLADQTRNEVYEIVNENYRRGIPKEVVDAQKDEIYKHAHRRAQQVLKVEFLIQEISRTESIKVSEQELLNQIRALSAEWNMSIEKTVKRLRENNKMEELQRNILHHKVMSFLELNAVVEEVYLGTPGSEPTPVSPA